MQKQAFFRRYPFFGIAKFRFRTYNPQALCLIVSFLRSFAQKYARYILRPVVIGAVGMCSERIIFMGQRRERLNTRLVKQAKTRRANAPRKAEERVRKAARTAAAQ